MELFDENAIALDFPLYNPYTCKRHVKANLTETCMVIDLNDHLMDIQAASHDPIEDDLYLHYKWKLKNSGKNITD